MSEGGRWGISTRLSVGDPASLSHEVQLAACRQLVAREGGVIVLETSDTESGLVETREGYQRHIALARRGDLDKIAVYRWDRFGRDNAESFARIKEFGRLGVEVWSATQPNDPFVRDLFLVLANQESRVISARVKAAMTHLVRSGRYIAIAPFGYRLVSDPDGRRHLVVVPDEAELYRRMVDRYLAGESVRSICAWARTQLDSEGRPFRTSRGQPITRVYLRNAILNPLYAGIVRWNRRQKSKVYGNRDLPASEHIHVPDAAPAIIDADTRARVLAEHARRKTNHGQARASAYGLTGLLRCRCGEKMYGSLSSTPHSSPGVYYYRCASQVRGGCGTANMRGLALEWEIAAAILDPAVLAGVTAAGLAARHAARSGAGSSDRRREGLRRDIARQRERISEATTLLIDGVIDREEYARQVAVFEGARREAERELGAVAVAPAFDARAVLAAIPRQPVDLEAVTAPERRKLFRAFVARADWDGGALAVEWTPAGQALLGEGGRAFAAPPIRKRGGYAAWGRDVRD